MTRSPEWVKLRRRLVGVVFLLVFALLIWLSLALYHKAFTPVSTVTLYTNSVGNEMHTGAEVMVRGVQIGQVQSITADGTGARLQLAIQPGMVPRLPANVTALMVPTTLFGERYVDLLIHAHGKQLGQTLVQLSSVLHRYNPHLPALDNDIKQLAGVARTLNAASPDLLQALDDFTVTSQTLTSEQASFSALYSTVTTASDDIRAFLDTNSNNIISLSTASTATLQILARYSPEFPCVLTDLKNFVPAADKLLGKGTNQPGLHVQAVILPVYANARYLPGVDTPKYGDDLGPHCYSVPFKGITLNDGTSPLSGGAASGTGAGAGAGAGAG